MPNKELSDLQKIVSDKIKEIDFTFEDEIVKVSRKLKSMIEEESKKSKVDKEYLSLITLDYLLKTWLN